MQCFFWVLFIISSRSKRDSNASLRQPESSRRSVIDRRHQREKRTDVFIEGRTSFCSRSEHDGLLQRLASWNLCQSFCSPQGEVLSASFQLICLPKRKEIHKQLLQDGILTPEVAPFGHAHLTTVEDFRELFESSKMFDGVALVGMEGFTNGQEEHFRKLQPEEKEAFVDLVEMTSTTTAGISMSDHFLYIGKKRWDVDSECHDSLLMIHSSSEDSAGSDCFGISSEFVFLNSFLNALNFVANCILFVLSEFHHSLSAWRLSLQLFQESELTFVAHNVIQKRRPNWFVLYSNLCYVFFWLFSSFFAALLLLQPVMVLVQSMILEINVSSNLQRHIYRRLNRLPLSTAEYSVRIISIFANSWSMWLVAIFEG